MRVEPVLIMKSAGLWLFDSVWQEWRKAKRQERQERGVFSSWCVRWLDSVNLDAAQEFR